MTDFFRYALETSAGMGLFLALYRVFLQKETYFTVNRLFLLGTLAISLVIPLLAIPVHLPAQVESMPLLNSIPTVFIKSGSAPIGPAMTASNPFSLFDFLVLIYLSGAIFMLMRFLYSLSGLLDMHLGKKKQFRMGLKIITTAAVRSPHSFFSTVFMHPNQFHGSSANSILAHEKIHARQLHSLDILIIELLSFVFWFNPFIYLYKKALQELHEFLADRGALLSGQDRETYRRSLLEQSLRAEKWVFVSGYRQSLTKKRLTMMTKQLSRRSAAFKLVLALPIIALLTFSFALAIDRTPPAADTLDTVPPETPATPAVPVEEAVALDEPVVPPVAQVISVLPDGRILPTPAVPNGGIVAVSVPDVPVSVLPVVAEAPEVSGIYSVEDGIVIRPPVDADDIISLYSESESSSSSNGGENYVYRLKIRARAGSEVTAGSQGIVLRTGKNKELGRHIVIGYAKDYTSIYGNLDRIAIINGKTPEAGTEVEAGDVLGYVGKEGDDYGDLIYEFRSTTRPARTPRIARVTDERSPRTQVYFDVEGVDQPPELVGGKNAILKYIQEHELYPEKARQAKMSGTVTLEFIVGTDGKANDISVVEETPDSYGFASAAIQALLGVQFKPGENDGEKVPVMVRQTIEFKMK